MGLVFKYIWGTKVFLLGFSAYKSCTKENEIICFLSASYFCILVLATLCSWKILPKPQDIDSLEEQYLQRLEEGIAFEKKKDE